MKRQFLSFTLLLALSTWIAQAATVRGTVSDTAGKPLQGVVVTDGYNFTQTNERGEYSLDSNLDKSRFVYLSVPGDYEIEQTKGIPDLFYQQLDKSKEINEHDFTLTPRKQPIDGFVYLAISDPQTIDERQMKRFREETIPDLKQTIERYQGKEVYGMALGDITWDRMDLFTPYKEAVSVLGIPMFSVIGNHDHDLNKFTDREATENYRSHFGPTYYAFDMGRTHYIVLDDIVYHGAKKYDEQIDSLQLAWAAEYARRLPAGSRVCVAMHAPAMKAWKGNQVMESAARLMDAFAGHELHFITGHTHVNSNYDIREGVVEHNVAQICGNLWYDPINKDGTPKGYQLFRECGGEFSWEYRSLGSPAVRQLRVWQPGQVEAFPGSVVAKIWNWDPCWTVVWYEDGRYRGAMQRIQIVDPDYAAHLDSLKNAGRKLAKSQHPRISDFYFKARPSASAQTIEVVATDRFGRRYSERITLEKAQ